MFANQRAEGVHAQRVRQWQTLVRYLNKTGLSIEEVRHWRLEQLSTYLEARASLKGAQLDQGHPTDYLKALESLKSITGHVIMARGGTRDCPLHEALFRSIKPKAVISFNYDLIADQTLLKMGNLNWKRKEYSGGKTASIPKEPAGLQSYSRQLSNFRLWSKDFIRLLKLHGSIHWERKGRGNGHRISGCQLPQGQGELFNMIAVSKNIHIVPPVAAKMQIQEETLKKLWYEAVDELQDASQWIIWGYSFPQTDTIAHVLFRAALARHKKPKPVIIINPDPSVVDRVRTICRKIKIAHVASVERFLLDRGLLVPRSIVREVLQEMDAS